MIPLLCLIFDGTKRSATWVEYNYMVFSYEINCCIYNLGKILVEDLHMLYFSFPRYKPNNTVNSLLTTNSIYLMRKKMFKKAKLKK